MNTAVAKIEPQQTGISADVRRMESQFALALPEHVSPERFVRVVVTAIQSNPDLQRADRDSVLGAALKCAQDGLVPDGREAALVVYGGKAAYLPMIAGVLAKVRRSGELLTISAHVVHEHDAFTYTLGDDETIEHRPELAGPRGKPIAVYAVAKTKDGGVYREVMSIEEIERVRNVSKAKNNGPWVQWWGEMARKTVLRRLSKRLPMSTDLQQVFSRDDEHYDLTRAEGQAKLRRLHADFDEPADPAADAEIEVAVSISSTSDEAEKMDKPSLKSGAEPDPEKTPAEAPPPASVSEVEGAAPSDAPEPPVTEPNSEGPVEPLEWKVEAERYLSLAKTSADVSGLNAQWGADGHLERLAKRYPAEHRELVASIKATHAELKSKER